MRYSGKIGFVSASKETAPGVWQEETIAEKQYYGDIIRNYRNLQSADKVNDDITINNQISIVADPFANQNMYLMRYATFQGQKWKITSIEAQYPRLLLTLGGIYNEEST